MKYFIGLWPKKRSIESPDSAWSERGKNKTRGLSDSITASYSAQLRHLESPKEVSQVVIESSLSKETWPHQLNVMKKQYSD